MDFLRCILWVAAIGIISSVVGIQLPRRWFDPERFPYHAYEWEKGGKFYDKLHIRVWKDRVPDLSKYCKQMCRKQVDTRPSAADLDRLVRETCVAEAVHWILMVLSLPVIMIWDGPGGWFFYILCILGNLPFVIIQRYNRPRLMKMLSRMRNH